MTDRAHSSVGFPDRLLAEAVRALEHDGGAPLEEPAAEAAAVDGGGDFEQRLVTRAANLSVAGSLRQALRRTGRVFALILAAGLLVAAVIAASASQASLTGEDRQTVNVFWALGGLLGIQTIVLLVWIAMMIRTPAALSGLSLGGIVLNASRQLAARWQPTAAGAAALEAFGSVMAKGRLGAWVLGAVSHSLWIVFNVVCLLLIVFMLSARHYRFVWETTILSADTYVSVTRAVGWLPSRLGFPTPARHQIVASDGAPGNGTPPTPDDDEAMRHAWSGFLVGCIVTYGLAPRVFLFGLCAWRQVESRRRYRLDTSRPGYMRLRSRLMPSSASLGVVDPDTGPPTEPAPPAAPSTASAEAGGPPALFGLEIAPPETGWPPKIGVQWRDLGFVDGRHDRERVLAGLSGAPMAVAVCGLTTTPDRGIGAFLRDARAAAGQKLGLVLTGGETLRRRGNGRNLATRVADWHELAKRVGVDEGDVLEMDLDHMTDSSSRGLAELVGAEVDASVSVRHLEEAFDAIVTHAGGWRDTPDDETRARLHQDIAKIYRSEAVSWGGSIGATVKSLTADPVTAIRRGADSITSLLPMRLKTDAKWAVAGAAAGALGCIAAAAVVAPAAIAALPAWSALGAGVTAAIRALTPTKATDVPSDDHAGRADAVRAAALFALLLELQSCDEATITRRLDEAVGSDELDATSPDSIRPWLDGVRHRLDLAGGTS